MKGVLLEEMILAASQTFYAHAEVVVFFSYFFKIEIDISNFEVFLRFDPEIFG